MRPRSFWRGARAAALAFCAAAAGSGCTGGRGEEARAQFAAAVEAVKEGSLERAYAAAMPPAYDGDLNDLLVKARGLVGEEDLALLRDVLRKAGQKASPLVALMGVSSPSAALLAEKLKDLPAALGLESLESLRSRDVEGLLAALDRGLFAEVSRAQDIQESLSRIDVQLEDHKGDWARLAFVRRGPAGMEISRERADVILVDGKWVLDGWVTEWPRQIDALRAKLAELAEVRKQDPELLRRHIEGLGKLLEEPGPLIAANVRRFAGEPAGQDAKAGSGAGGR
ncbi:MAG: hypothetical protein HY721_26860 [Planctomycetes bacterium]|nr:hypothetical protein [Planctomycetota bacterium]